MIVRSLRSIFAVCPGLLAVLILFLPTAGQGQPAQLVVTIIDGATGAPTPVRVRLTDADGRVASLPEAAIGIQYGRDDRAEGYAFQPDSAFYVAGAFAVALPPGTYHLTLSKGFEYVKQQHVITLDEGETLAQTFVLERWIDMPRRGWYAADDHIHIRRSPRENPLILTWIAAEDIHVGALLQMGDFWTSYYAQYAWGQAGVYQVEDRLLTSGQEDPRTHEVGHTIALAADAPVRFSRDYYLYDRVFDRVHELGGLTGYAHQGMSFHGYRGMTLDVLRKKVDFLELLQFCVPEGPLHLEHYYHFLDLGYKLTATAGSDFPWCGTASGWSAQIGNARFYTYVGDAFTFAHWKANLAAGHTFVSSGPMLDLKVNGALPGDSLKVDRGSSLRVTAVAYGHEAQVPLQNLEVVAHGRVIGRVIATEPGQSSAQLRLELDLTVEHGLWIAARCTAGATQVAHTTPVYVTTGGGGFHNPETAPRYLELSEQYLQELEQELAHRDDRVDHHAWRYREGLAARIAEARAVLEDLRIRFE